MAWALCTFSEAHPRGSALLSVHCTCSEAALPSYWHQAFQPSRALTRRPRSPLTCQHSAHTQEHSRLLAVPRGFSTAVTCNSRRRRLGGPSSRFPYGTPFPTSGTKGRRSWPGRTPSACLVRRCGGAPWETESEEPRGQATTQRLKTTIPGMHCVYRGPF